MLIIKLLYYTIIVFVWSIKKNVPVEIHKTDSSTEFSVTLLEIQLSAIHLNYTTRNSMTNV